MTYKHDTIAGEVEIPTNRPRHGVVVRNNMQNNGLFIPNPAVFVSSGSLDVVGSATGSVTLRFDAYGLRLRRFEIFHSGAASSFDVSIESASPNTGSFFDPRDIVVEYDGIQGSNNYTGGLDQIEDLVAMTDLHGSLYLKVKPNGSGNNSFLYKMFLEAVYIYIER